MVCYIFQRCPGDVLRILKKVFQVGEKLKVLVKDIQRYKDRTQPEISRD